MSLELIRTLVYPRWNSSPRGKTGSLLDPNWLHKFVHRIPSSTLVLCGIIRGEVVNSMAAFLIPAGVFTTPVPSLPQRGFYR
jgi:hypothetical protein